MNYPLIAGQFNFLLLGFGRPILPLNTSYLARINIKSERNVLGDIISMDARGSYVSNGNDPKYYFWSFIEVPIGSMVKQTGFKVKDEEAQFTPDKTGIYKIQLIVGDSFGRSNPVEATISVDLLVLSEGQSVMPKVDWIFDAIGDFWTIY